jgi:hypothetical protein
MKTKRIIEPRIIRLRDASRYLGMDKNRFNADVRPFLSEIPIGVQGIAFDRLELDAFADYYVQVRGRPPERRAPWQESVGQVSANAGSTGTLKKSSKDTDSTRRLARQIIEERRRITTAASTISVKS